MSDRRLEICLGDLIVHNARVKQSDDGVALVADVVIGQAVLVDGRHRGLQIPKELAMHNVMYI